ncbi:MAG: hypothetical protein WCW13_04225 [archaeon]|jgi:hypothetical protein
MVGVVTVDNKVKAVKKELTKEKAKNVKQVKTVNNKVKAVKKELKAQKSRGIKQADEINKLKVTIDNLKKKKVKSGHISEYNFFIRKQILLGRSFLQAVKEWNKYKALQSKNKRRPSAYNQFIGSQMRLGKTFIQAVALWKLAKAGTLGKKGKTRTITKTITKTRTIKSKPKIQYRNRTRTIIKSAKAQPMRRTVTRIVSSAPSFDMNSLREVLSSTVSSSSISKSDLKEALSSDNEEIAFKLVQTYFIEVARLGFKRQLTLDEIINAYLYALARVRRQSVEMNEVATAVKEAEGKN